MIRTEALRVLGLAEDHDEPALREAFARAIKSVHPDTAEFGKAFMIAKAKKARDLLLRRFAEPLPECVPCQGKGVIKGLSKFGTTCKACQGTGRNTR